MDRRGSRRGVKSSDNGADVGKQASFYINRARPKVKTPSHHAAASPLQVTLCPADVQRDCFKRPGRPKSRACARIEGRHDNCLLPITVSA